MKIKLARRQVEYVGETPEERLEIRRHLDAAAVLEKYRYAEGELAHESEEELKKRVRSPFVREVRFLDGGAGHGRGVSLARGLHKKIKAFGMSPAPPKQKYASEREWIQAYFEEAYVPNWFDVIQTRNALTHAANNALALENLLNSLRKGGVLLVPRNELAYTAPARPTHDRFAFGQENATLDRVENMLGELERQGFKISVTKSDDAKITKGKRPADLTRYYADPFINRFPVKTAS